MLSIGELSHRTGVKVTTIRYYEKQGLIDAPCRTGGDQRRYDRDSLERLQFIRHARDLGLPLGQIGELLALSKQPGAPCRHAHAIATRHLSSVRDRIASLNRLAGELERIARLGDDGNVADCKVLGALGDHSMCVSGH